MSNLAPTSIEALTLPSGRNCRIPKCKPRFTQWHGEPVDFTYGGKDLLALDGEAAFAEIVVLRLLQASGWEGVWVDTFAGKYRVSNTEAVDLSIERAMLLDSIFRNAQSKNGCFDIYAWRGDALLFAEVKKKSEDQIRNSQLRWLDAALAVGLPEESFLIVEWSSESQPR